MKPQPPGATATRGTRMRMIGEDADFTVCCMRGTRMGVIGAGRRSYFNAAAISAAICGSSGFTVGS